MNEIAPVPVARPIVPAESRYHGPIDLVNAQPTDVVAHGNARPRADRLAIASAACGFTGFIPIVSQVAGLGLGVASLVRIGRARRRGIAVAGSGWAWAGIVSSGFALLGWFAAAGALAVVGSSISGSSTSLQQIFQATGR